MATATEQIGNIFTRIPLKTKIAMSLVLLLVVGGFFAMYTVGSKMEYQPLYGKLSAENEHVSIIELVMVRQAKRRPLNPCLDGCRLKLIRFNCNGL